MQVNKFIQNIRKTAREVERALNITNKIMKKKVDKKQGEAIKYIEVWEEAIKYIEVWVESSNINSDWLAKKLAFKRTGSFYVIKKIRSSAYELKIPKIWKNIHPVINKSKLKPYHYPIFVQ